MIHYSPSQNGFYDERVNAEIPQDAIKITEQRWQELLDGQMTGKKIQADKNGNPQLVGPTDMELATSVRARRDELLRMNVDSMNPMRWASMSEAQQSAWMEYRQALLDVPAQDGFPNVVWPIKPE